jgi:hypothetical protein
MYAPYYLPRHRNPPQFILPYSPSGRPSVRIRRIWAAGALEGRPRGVFGRDRSGWACGLYPLLSGGDSILSSPSGGYYAGDRVCCIGDPRAKVRAETAFAMAAQGAARSAGSQTLILRLPRVIRAGTLST